jgi:histidinol phosphatase-like PHP family hydrolase
MDRVIKALVKNDVAFEINARYKIPSVEFLKKAKAAGVKFTFGTNNTMKDDLEYSYCFQVMKELNLTAADIWMPRKQGTKKIQNLKK